MFGGMSIPPQRRKTLLDVLSWLLFVGWACLVLWASLDFDPFKPLVRLISWDKFLHAAAYAVLTFLGGLALRTLWTHHPVRAWLSAFSFSALFGLCVELLQHSVTTSRSGEWFDLVANILGSVFVLTVAVLLENRKKNK
jgi:glycopeptide antibiotics resistance protein